MFLQSKDSLFDIEWTKGVTYGDVHLQGEKEFSRFNFDASNPEILRRHFEECEGEARRLVDQNLILPAYDFCLKTSHLFNLLDARGAVSVSERPRYIGRVRALARACAQGYLASREAQGFPLQKKKKK